MPTLTVTGLDGLPKVKNAGNVLHPKLKIRLSFRLPPNLNPKKVEAFVKEELERDPPY